MPNEQPPKGSGETHQPQRPNTFFDRLLSEHPEINRQRAVVAPPSILRLIGGPNTMGIPVDVDRAANLGIGARKVDDTGVQDDAGTKTVRPSDLIVPMTPEAMGAVGDFIDEAERKANGGFPFALDEARAFIAQRKAEGHETDFLFIQGEIYIDDGGTGRRIKKLAQALGIPIGYVYYERNTFNRTFEQWQRGEGVDYDYSTWIDYPPTGKTADDYWERIAESRKPHGYDDSAEPLNASPRYYSDIVALLQIERPDVGDYWAHLSPAEERQMHRWGEAQRTAHEKLRQLYRLGDNERSSILSIIGREQLVTTLQDHIAGREIFVDGDTIVFGIALEVLGKIDQKARLGFSLGLIEKLASTKSKSGKGTELADTPGTGNFAHLLYVIHRDMHDLVDQLHPAERARAVKTLKTLAFRKEKNTDNARITAREVLAELGDVDTRDRILAEAANLRDVDRAHFTIGEPLAIYLKTDTQLTDRLVTRVNSLVEAGTYNFEAHRLIEALMSSGRPEVSKLLRQVLLNTDAKDKSFRDYIASTIFMNIDRYIAALQKYPEGVDKQAALDSLGTTLDTFLSLCKADRQDARLQHKMPYSNTVSVVRDAMLNIGNSSKSRDLLRQEVLESFVRGGQILDNEGFQDLYLKYRTVYGPIPEIDQFVVIRQ